MYLIRSFDLCPLERNEREVLDSGEFRLGGWCTQLLPLVPASHQRVGLLTRVITPGDLGFAKGATWGAIVLAAHRLNLGFIPARLVLPLRLRYREQPRHSFIRVAHTPIAGMHERTFRLALYRDESHYRLHMHEGCADDELWPADCPFMFAYGYGTL